MIQYRFLTVLSLILVIIGLACGSTFAAGIRIVPSSTQVIPGEEFFFDVVAEGIPAEGLGGVQFRLNLSAPNGTVTGVPDLTQAGVNDIAVVSPLVVSPATPDRSGIGDFFWNGKGPNGILVMDNETLVNGSALYTFAHTNGATPPSGSGAVARFAVRIGTNVKAEQLNISLSDVMLLDGGPVYPLDYTTGASVQLRCMTKAPSLLGLSLADAQAALNSAKLSAGTVYELDNQTGTRQLNVVLEQSVTSGSDLLCQSTVNIAVNTPPADPGNVRSVDKTNDDTGSVILSWTPSASADAAGYRVYSGAALLKQISGAASSGAELSGLPNGLVTRLTVKAYDTYGNESSGAGVDATPLDDVPPVVTIAGVAEGAFYRNSVTPQVSVADASQTTWSAILNSAPSTLTAIGTDGTYTLVVTAVDQANNHSSKSVSFTVDQTPPAITVNNVADGTYYKTGVTPVIAVSDTYLKNSSITLNGQTYLSGTLISDPGSYTLLANADDIAGNSASQVIRFTIDTTPPVLTVSTLSDGSYTNNEVLNVSGTVTDNIGVKELLINGISVAVNADGSYSHALVLADGKNTIEVKATDMATNQVIDTRTIYLDQKAPLIDITSPADNSKTGKPEIVVTGNVDEASTVEVRLNGVIQPSERDGFAFSATLTPVYGSNTIEVIAIDQATNKGTEKRTVIFDDQKPSLAITEPGQDIRTNRDVLILKGTVSDALTKVSIKVEMDGTTYTPAVIDGSFEQRLVMIEEKNYAIIVTATDEADNSISVQRNVIFDVTPPALTIDPVSPTNQQAQVLSGTREEGSSISVNCVTANAGLVEFPTATTWKVALNDLTVGDNAITVTATDDAGNPNTASTNIIYDITPPTGSILINSGAGITASTQVALNLSAADTNGISQMQLSNDAMVWTDPEPFAGQRGWYLLPGDGPKQVYVRYKDSAGNWSVESVVASIVLDTTPPVVSASPAGGIYKAAQSVQLSVNEAATIYCTTDGSTPTTLSAVYSGPLTIASSTTLSCLAMDSTGNPGRHSESYIIDTISPVLNVSTLPDGAYTNNEVLNISGTVADNIGVKELLINGAPVPFGTDGKFSQALLLKSGENRVEVKAIDLATNTVEDNRTINLDQRAPLLVIDNPSDNSMTNKPLIDVTGNVDETSTVEVSLKGILQPVTMNGNVFTSTVALVPGADPNTINIKAIDLAKNSSSDKRSVYYDDQAPSLAITGPGQDIRTNQGSLTIQGTASDPYGFGVTISMEMDGQKFEPPLINGKFEQTVTFVTEGTYHIVATATNEAKSSASTQRNIIYDITPPTLTINPVQSPTTSDSQTVSGTMEPGLVLTVSSPTATIGAVTYPSATTWQVSISGLKPGSNIIIASTTDAANNVATASKEIVYTVSTSTGIFSAAIFGNSKVTMTGGSYTDSYINSPSNWIRGKYTNGDIGTNSLQSCGIQMSGRAQVFGKAWVGHNGNPATGGCMNGGSSVSGGIGELAVAKDMTPKIDPAGGASIGAITLSGHGARTLTTGNYRVPSITLTGGSTLTLNGTITLHVDGNFSLSGNSKIVIASGAVTIYQNGQKLDISGGTVVNNSMAPANLTIYGTAGLQIMNLSGNSDLHALVYAPTAAIKLSGGQDTFGSVIGNTVDVSGGASVHYDESLSN